MPSPQRARDAGRPRHRRAQPDAPFETPQRVSAIEGFTEAPALSPDGRSLYFHKREGNRFAIWRVTRAVNP